MAPLADDLETLVPYLRRYARALTGEQTIADNLAYKALKAIQKDRSLISSDHPIKLSLYRTFHREWTSAELSPDVRGLKTSTPVALNGLTPNSREALLLATLEGFDREAIGFIVGLPPDDAADLLREAARDMQTGGTGKVLIIEDDAIIATDLKKILEDRGHQVIAVARTVDEAMSCTQEEPPELVLADVQLADGSSGIDAVRHILKEFGQMPIIFVTAFPERLLTGQRPEPAFLITKPYRNEQVASAVSQAMFFATTTALPHHEGSTA